MLGLKFNVAKVIAELKEVKKPGMLYVFIVVVILILQSPEIINALAATGIF